MDIPDYAGAIEDALLAYHANVENGDDDNLLRYTRFTTCFIVEMSKRWAERKYIFKRTGVEVTIQECVQKSMEATEKFFRRAERKAAPENLSRAMSEAEELFAFLEQEPKPKDDPAEKHNGAGDQEKPNEAEEEVPEPPEEAPEPAANPPSTAELISPTTTLGERTKGPQEYPTMSKEEFAKIPPR